MFEEGFGDMCQRMPDTSKINELIAWRPMKSLDDIIADVVSDLRGAHATDSPTSERQPEPTHRFS
ncbi:MAG: hypothetical protein GEU68_10085 [Actinobacteria bacterium]|nr:hypothetical protein [Actinomycetota bacterium]